MNRELFERKLLTKAYVIIFCKLYTGIQKLHLLKISRRSIDASILCKVS